MARAQQAAATHCMRQLRCCLQPLPVALRHPARCTAAACLPPAAPLHAPGSGQLWTGCAAFQGHRHPPKPESEGLACCRAANEGDAARVASATGLEEHHSCCTHSLAVVALQQVLADPLQWQLQACDFSSKTVQGDEHSVGKVPANVLCDDLPGHLLLTQPGTPGCKGMPADVDLDGEL